MVHTSQRWVMSGVGGVMAAVGLAAMMMALIRVEFRAEEAFEVAEFDINPVEIDEPVIMSVRAPAKLKTIETPPPPPVIERAEAEQPSEPIATVGDARPVLVGPDIRIGMPVVHVMDNDEQPIYRAAPAMPTRADRSGHCKMMFDIGPDGSPVNVQALFCSQSLFERSAIKATQKFKYRPRIVSGQAVTVRSAKTVIVYNLKDEHGNIIPE